MTCHDARELLSDWIDDALTGAEREGMRAHLAECLECRRELERFEGTVALLHRVERPRAPAGFVERVLQAANPVPWHRRILRRLFVPVSMKLPAEAAALLLVAGLAAYVFQRTPELRQAAQHDIQAPLTVPSKASPTEPAPAAAPPAPEDAQKRMLLRRDAPPPPASGRMFTDARQSTPAKQAREAPVPPESRTTVPVAPEAQMRPSANEAAKASPATPSPAERSPSSGGRAESQKDTARSESSAGTLEPSVPAQPSTQMLRQSLDSAMNKTQAAPPAPPTAAPPSAPRGLPPSDVVGRLSVKDRGGAERALQEALARAGGFVVSRREEGGATVVDVAVPATTYPEFSEGLSRIGAWRPEVQPADLPQSVRITLRLVE